ncbi:MAG: Rrf2 family transcriptional regulator [Zoogloeaceae bacterium]|jgi:Rrf2 family iron-sulfur cluster assembly transcriptional regulator|nr:Rrf2 family transcriptional regulator [Zoogloeaceae bacterium]
MRLTTKGRFAVTAMMDLALHDRKIGDPVSLMSICERQNISISYMEQLFSRLRRHGLISSVRGPGGGYHLARPMPKISVIDIIYAVDEHLDATLCGGGENCHNQTRCITHDLWYALNQQMLNYLRSVSLGDLVAQYANRQGGVLPPLASPARRGRNFRNAAPKRKPEGARDAA